MTGKPICTPIWLPFRPCRPHLAPPTPREIGARVYGYVRVSSDAQAEDGQSLAVQQRQLEGWAMQRGQALDAVYVEAGISGAIPFAERPEGGKLWAQLQKGDTLVAANHRLGVRRDDGQEQPGDAVARHVVGTAIEIKQEQRHPARLERLDDCEAVRRGSEHAVQLGRHQGVSLLQRRPKLRALGAFVERDGAAWKPLPAPLRPIRQLRPRKTP
jgi:Resolvase, N terminal domain